MMLVRSMTAATTALGLALAVVATPTLAQTSSNPLDLRVGKLEKEMKAVQRTVFPQGVPVQPDLSAAPATTIPSGTPASAPLSDLTTRVDTLEKSLATVTGASEQNAYRLKQLEEALAKVQSRLTALEGGAPATGSPAATSGTALPTVTAATTTTVTAPEPKPAPATAAPKPTATAKPAPAKADPAPAKADPARKAAVAAIEMPATGDAVEDDYTYGFRLYTAKFYPEAQAKLKEFTAKYPATNKRWSYAQNLLGRAYYDEGKPALASVAFYDNYQKAPRGERAADSLTWLGQSLIKLKKTADACKVFDELNDVYGTKLTPDQKARAAKGRADAKCGA
jgi:TolA-binding protein